MSLVNKELLREDIREFQEIVEKKANMSLLRSLIKRPSISVLKAMMKMLEEHKRLINSGSYNANDYEYYPNEKTQKKYLKIVRRLLVDVYGSFNRESEYIPQTSIETKKLGDISVDWVSPINPDKSKVLLHIHGGGYVVGTPEIYHAFAARLAVMTDIEVVIPDYRLAPEHKFPAGLFDCLEVYQELLDMGYKSDNIILTGDSAGAGMVLAMLLYLRDQEMPLPGGAIPMSPYADLTFDGTSIVTKAEKDIVVADFPMYFFANSYIEKENIGFEFPLVSPVFGDFRQLPDLCIIVSKDEMLYDDSIRITNRARAADVNVELIEVDDMPHVYPCLAATQPWKEVDEAFQTMQKFILKTFYQKQKEELAIDVALT